MQKPNKATAAAAENGNGDDPLLLRVRSAPLRLRSPPPESRLLLTPRLASVRALLPVAVSKGPNDAAPPPACIVLACVCDRANCLRCCSGPPLRRRAAGGRRTAGPRCWPS